MTVEPVQGAAELPAVRSSSPLAAEPSHAWRRREGEYWHRRRHLERQLHDGPALRISALTLRLGLLGQKLPGGQPELQRDIDDLQAELHAVQQELRALADQIYPPLLYEAGLGPALRELAGRAPVRMRVDASDDRFDPAIEAVAYFAVVELLDVAADGGATVAVAVRKQDCDLVLEIGAVDTVRGSELLEQIRRLGGVVDVPAGSSTQSVRVRIPCE
jgi:signal transduction histidine kinase